LSSQSDEWCGGRRAWCHASGLAENGEVDIVVYVDELVRKVRLEQLRAAGTRCRVTVGLNGANAACERDLIILGS
jgi:hypothetical protein